MVARAHTMAHDGGRLLPGHLAAADLAELQAMVPPGLTFDPAACGRLAVRVPWLVVALATGEDVPRPVGRIVNSS